MTIDATFWVAVSFFIFIGLLIYLKIPQKVKETLDESIFSIKSQINEAEKLREEAENLLSENEKKLGNSKKEIQLMINKANEDADKNVLKINSEFHEQMENRKKNAELRIKQMKDQAFKDIRNMSVKVAVQSVEKLLKNSLDKNKLDKLYYSSVEETKLALKKNSG
tara:strand:- start:264 stop:761 length:498 start_codon:yes stop_codon:yes gene_type:complete